MSDFLIDFSFQELSKSCTGNKHFSGKSESNGILGGEKKVNASCAELGIRTRECLTANIKETCFLLIAPVSPALALHDVQTALSFLGEIK